ncbi:DNA replication and repair protein RecF [Butyrivibrio fibrisolvens DSM 3071]|jgi:DNA replication and repair protein RecF|uniref:DNA replication and repair protein RecF n=1 Tax=Butyrivibrio fibrisolvens DSM 3071 TaxID=1121131 RepID=A0A1M6C590_BUTFI|nr:MULTISPECIES: DNA replication/repair protein RecF [Butyrivibrio]SHI56103.1 DNA replication and repair protein RecF [Butyrivibrio fibrisolvens DSM 3071]
MIIKQLELLNFRNYEELHLDFDRGTNILYGDNAQGKTNILEAIFMSATTKSHKGSKDREVIRFGNDEAHIRSIIERDHAEYKLDMHLRKSKTKGLAIDGQKLKKAADYVGHLNAVFFSPEDLAIVKNGPSERRRFLDLELCQLDETYLYNLSRFNRLIVQRNKMLKEMYDHPEYRPLLDVQDDQMITYGTQIIKAREEFIGNLCRILEPIHEKLTGGRENLKIFYEPNVSADDYESKLKKAKDRDLFLKQTSVGPQKDDFSFIVKAATGSDAIDIRKFGSQGQQRTASLSLKLSEIEIVKQAKKENPVLLLDDVLSELDSNRQNYLLDTIGDIQTIITCTGYDEFVNHRFEINKLFRVVNGTVTSEN